MQLCKAQATLQPSALDQRNCNGRRSQPVKTISCFGTGSFIQSRINQCFLKLLTVEDRPLYYSHGKLDKQRGLRLLWRGYYYRGVMSDYLSDLYDKVFEQEFSGLQRRRESDAEFTVADLKRQLKDLYAAQGDDWLGRGGVGNTTYDATIAAWESFCARWEKDESE